MQLIFHGGAQEVGRSCVEVRTNGDRYLLDCGLKFHEGGFDYPAKVFESRALDGVFLSHAHLDHSGGLPFLVHYRMRCPIFCTQETDEIARILLKDSERIAHLKHLHEAFTKVDMKDAVGMFDHVPYNDERRHRSIAYTFLNAGHIPGSATIRVRAEGLTIAYTGDYNVETTRLMLGADPRAWGGVDILITESTYAERDHPDRERMERDFIDAVDAVVRRGGRVLIPVFAVGRAQEVLIMLNRRTWAVPIYLDGMARKVTHAIIEGPCPYATNKQSLRDALRTARPVGSREERTAVAGEGGIFVTTSGMLQGGPALYYLDQIWNDPKSAVFLTGFQVRGTPGWHLDEERSTKIEGERVQVQCEVRRFDFSAHLSRQGIQDTIRTLRPKIVIFVHGDPASTRALVAWVRDEIGATAYAPVVGDQIDIDPTGRSSSVHAYTAEDGYRFPDEHQHRRLAFDDYSTDGNGA